MDWSLPRCRSAAAISYGYIGRSVSNVSSDSASRLPTFRRLAIVSHLVPESSYTRTRYQVLVYEYRHMGTPTAMVRSRCAIGRALTRPMCHRLFSARSPGAGADTMKPGFRGVRTRWNPGFMLSIGARRRAGGAGLAEEDFGFGVALGRDQLELAGGLG